MMICCQCRAAKGAVTLPVNGVYRHFCRSCLAVQSKKLAELLGAEVATKPQTYQEALCLKLR